MAIQQKQIDYSKELDDVMVLLIALTKDIKAKKSLPDITTDVLPKLISAMDGVNQVGDEISSNHLVAGQTMGYRFGELVETIID
jgi:hypothetical protein